MGLNVSLSFVQAPTPTTLKSVLVLGGSSGVGAAAIQLLRRALPKATILTTSSAKHHSHLISLGATKCFDRTVEPQELSKSTPEGLGVDGMLDAVGGAADVPGVFDVLSPNGPRLYSQVLTGKTVNIPDGVNSKAEIAARDLFTLPGGMTTMSALANLVRDKQFKVPVKIESVGKGLDAIPQGLETLKNGVSGTKCVISMP